MGIAASALLAGCSLPHLDTLVPHASSEYASADRLGGEAGAWPAAGWWQKYNDNQLNALVDEALRQSPTLAEAQARAAAADAVAEQSGASLYPTLEANGSLEKIKQSYNNGAPAEFVPKGFQWAPRATLDLAYQLDLWGRNRKAFQAALSESEAARLEAQQAALSLSATVAETYASLAQLYADRDAAEDALKVRSQTAKLYEDRLGQGLENEGSYSQQLSEQAAAEAEIAAVDEQIGLAKNRLAALTGAGPDRGLSIVRPAKGAIVAQALPANIGADLIGRRPDIAAARARVEAAASRIKIAQTGFYPNINLMAYIGRQSLGLDLFTKSGSLIGAFGPAVSLPIFEGGRLTGLYRQAGAEYNAAVAAYNGSIVQALNEIADAATSRQALGRRLAATRKSLAASEKAYQIAQNRYKGGLSTYLEVLRAEDSLVAGRRAVADLQSRGFVLDVSLIRALGGGFAVDAHTPEAVKGR